MALDIPATGSPDDRGGAADSLGFRRLPHSEAAEMALLGAILHDNRAIERAGDRLRAEHFAIGVHRAVFAAIRRVTEEKRMIADPITLAPLLAGDELFQRAGGIDYLFTLAASAPPVAQVADYARMIHDTHLRRELIAAGQAMIADAHDEEIDRDGAAQIEASEERLYRLAEFGEPETGFRPFKAALAKAVRQADLASRRDGNLAGVPTGLIDLDQLLGGLHRSDLIIIAGRPGMGKTALATTMAFNAARGIADPETRTTHLVAFFSLEMSMDQLATRLLAEQVGVSGERIRRGDLRNDEFDRLMVASSEMEHVALFIDDTPALSISQLRTRARRLKRQHGRLSMVVVDYLQLLQPAPGTRYENRVQEVSQVTRALKALAKELDLPVVALSQLSRQVEAREDKRPQLADLRESGSIEQDADMVMFVYREEYYMLRQEPQPRADESSEAFSQRYNGWKGRMDDNYGVAEVIVAKQRHGPTDSVLLHFDRETTRFSNLVAESKQRYRKGSGGGF
jgi:replicative DNA helicase